MIRNAYLTNAKRQDFMDRVLNLALRDTNHEIGITTPAAYQSQLPTHLAPQI